jgi:kynurenine formamidase
MTTIVDLSHSIEHGMVTYPGLPGPVIGDHLARVDAPQHYAPGYEIQIGRVEMVANTGTYLDTPFHFSDDGHDLAGLDPARVTGVPGVVVPAAAAGEIGPDALAGLGDDDLAGRAVLFHTGWDQHWRTEGYGSVDHPHLAVATAERLVAAGTAVVGIDSLNIDGTDTGERPIHGTLLGAGIPIVEHLCHLEAVDGRPFTFTALPPAVRGMGSFPVRAVAVITG